MLNALTSMWCIQVVATMQVSLAKTLSEFCANCMCTETLAGNDEIDGMRTNIVLLNDSLVPLMKSVGKEIEKFSGASIEATVSAPKLPLELRQSENQESSLVCTPNPSC
jgi:hypothetical protein